MEENGTKLQLNIAMCYDHFQERRRSLIPGIVPEDFLCQTSLTDSHHQASESIESAVTPSNQNSDSEILQGSAVSLASTNNTDICVLETHYDRDEVHHEYLDSDLEQSNNNMINSTENCKRNDGREKDDDDDEFLKYVDIAMAEKPEDFTMVQKPPPSHHLQMSLGRRSQCKCDESTEVLMLMNSDYPEVIPKSTYSTTDSDVEVLMSEEIIESDWSSEHLNPLQRSNVCAQASTEQNTRANPTNSETENSPSCLADSCEEISSSQRPVFSDLDILDDDDLEQAERAQPSSSVLCDPYYQQLNRSQLLDVIQEQELRIQALEDIVKRYHQAQKRLFEHVDALRLELHEIRITPATLSRSKGQRQDDNVKDNN